MKTKKIAVFTSCEGHLSLAQAVGESLGAEHEVVYFQEVDEIFSLYVPLYQLFPAGHKIPYTISKHKMAMSILQNTFKKRYLEKLISFIEEHQPDVLINTYFMYNPVLEEVAAQHNIPFYNVVTDPKTVHPLIISPQATANLSFDTASTKDIQASLDQPAVIEPVGWFVRSAFETSYDQAEIRRQLHLHPDELTFLITAGSEGTTHILKILPALFQTNRPLQIIVACGNNKTLFRSVKALQAILKKMGSPHHIVPLKFTTKLHQYMQASDLIVGKAGPNSLFEATATKTPFFAITHISGQEDGNLDIINDYQLGFTEENPLKAVKMLQEIIDQPEKLEKLKAPIAKMAKYNQESKTKLKNMIG